MRACEPACRSRRAAYPHYADLVARIATHEQRHVDIYLEGTNAMKARLEETRTTVSCADVEKAIDGAWRALQADIERA